MQLVKLKFFESIIDISTTTAKKLHYHIFVEKINRKLGKNYLIWKPKTNK